jgi:hypothetical protein
MGLGADDAGEVKHDHQDEYDADGCGDEHGAATAGA